MGARSNGSEPPGIELRRLGSGTALLRCRVLAEEQATRLGPDVAAGATWRRRTLDLGALSLTDWGEHPELPAATVISTSFRDITIDVDYEAFDRAYTDWLAELGAPRFN